MRNHVPESLLPSRRHAAAFLRWLLSALPRLLFAKPAPDSAGMSLWSICELLLEILRMCSTNAFCRNCRGKALVRAALLFLLPKPALCIISSFPLGYLPIRCVVKLLVCGVRAHRAPRHVLLVLSPISRTAAVESTGPLYLVEEGSSVNSSSS